MKNIVTTLNSLRSTIETDNHVLRWFTYLITQPAVMAEIKQTTETITLYDRFKKEALLKGATYACFPILLLFTYSAPKHQVLILGTLMLVLAIWLHSRIKRSVAQISAVLLSRDFEKFNFGELTLYQIGEFYAKRYKITPLLTAMTSSDEIIRKCLIAAWVWGTFIIPAGFFYFWILLAAAYLLITALLNLSPVYNRLK